MKIVNRFLTLSCLCSASIFFQNCGGDLASAGGQAVNQTPAKPAEQNAPTPATAPTANPGVDTAFGLKGADRCRMIPGAYKETMFVYQNYTVKTRPFDNFPGESIGIFSKKDSILMSNPDGKHFYGMYGHYLFADQGTGPNGRNLVIMDIKKQKEAFRTPYLGEDIQILGNGKIWFFVPVDEKDVKKKPDCPDKDLWIAQGFTVGYGKRCVYDLNSGVYIQKSEYICTPLQ